MEKPKIYIIGGRQFPIVLLFWIRKKCFHNYSWGSIRLVAGKDDNLWLDSIRFQVLLTAYPEAKRY